MNTSKTSLLLGVALVLVAGMFFATISGLISIKPVPAANSLANGAYMTGHVTTMLADSEGTIKEYRQSDNVITNTGENCVVRLLFHDDGVTGQGNGAATGSCTGALNSPWTVVAIGTSTLKANGTNYILGSESSGSGLSRKAGLVTFTNSSGSAGDTSSRAVVEATFTNTGASVQIAESGLFNTTTVNTNSMLARQNFTAITVGNGDSLTVRWTVNIGGTQFSLAQ